jgi:hypothetical protein
MSEFVGIIGDLHGFYELLVDYSKVAKEAGAVAIIQAGDFGVTNSALNRYKSKSFYPHLPTFVIEGNHEEFSQWVGLEDIKEVMHNLFYVPRGHIMKLAGLNICFMGGASSIDKSYQGSSWDWREDIQPSDMERFRKNRAKMDGNIDLFITHVPNQSVIERNFDPKNKLSFGVPIYWQDKSAPLVEEIWNNIGKPPMFSCHMHRKVIDGNCRILDINEMVFYPPAPLLSAEEANAQMSPEVRALQKERLDDLESVRKSRIIPPMNEPEPWEHPISYNHPLSK